MVLALQTLATKEPPLYKLYVSDTSYNVILPAKVSHQVKRGLEQVERRYDLTVCRTQR